VAENGRVSEVVAELVAFERQLLEALDRIRQIRLDLTDTIVLDSDS
jgi:hypothetical protein